MFTIEPSKETSLSLQITFDRNYLKYPYYESITQQLLNFKIYETIISQIKLLYAYLFLNKRFLLDVNLFYDFH